MNLVELECFLHVFKEGEFYTTATFFVNPLDLDFFCNLCLRHTQSSVSYSQVQRKAISLWVRVLQGHHLLPGTTLGGGGSLIAVSKGTAQRVWLQCVLAFWFCVPNHPRPLNFPTKCVYIIKMLNYEHMKFCILKNISRNHIGGICIFRVLSDSVWK